MNDVKPAEAPVDPVLKDDLAVLQVLMAEHASVVSARSLAYNEAFTRAGMFLQALGMSFVGLSLLGAALGFSQEVLFIAMIVVAFDVLIGIATFRRVADTGREDLMAMQAMNRIRQGYVRVAPGSTPFITAGTYDDVPSVMGSYGFDEASTSTTIGNVAYGISTSLGLVGMVLAVVSGVLASLILLAWVARRRSPSSPELSPRSSCSRRSCDGRWAPRARTRLRSPSGSRRPALSPARSARHRPSCGSACGRRGMLDAGRRDVAGLEEAAWISP